MINALIKFFLENKLVTLILAVLLIGLGLMTAPFDWDLDPLPRDAVAIDAIPDLGENQQIVFTEWPGRSPQDIEDQITYPLTSQLLGIPGVKSVRSSSMFGFSSIYLIFEEGTEFYWSRSRILEKLSSLPDGLLPDGARPSLGPDATALGQVFWYTIEGRDSTGKPTGGWNLQELRSIQDFYVKYGLAAAQNVSEVASIGGFVKEYQVDVRPAALEAYNIGLLDVMQAVKNSNRDIGAKTLEINRAEYLVRGLGYIKSVEDLEEAVIKTENDVPVRIKDVAVVKLGPASRRGALDKGGAEVVGGVVIARHGANPLQVIKNVKSKITEIEPGLPSKTLADGTVSKLKIVPFYDRTQLIYETLGTLEEALTLQLLITVIVIIVMVVNLRASLAISTLLPIAILLVFIAMRYTGVTANIVALSGIAIAIGTMVDLGIILTENVVKHLEENPAGSLLHKIYQASAEVSGAIVTAVSTTIISFIPVFTLQASEGKLFRPLAFTKTYALIAAVLIALFLLPSLLHALFSLRVQRKNLRFWLNIGLIPLGVAVLFWSPVWGILVILFGIAGYLQERTQDPAWYIRYSSAILSLVAIIGILSNYWRPLGIGKGLVPNIVFVVILVGLVLGLFSIVIAYYERILNWCLRHKKRFMIIPLSLLLLGAMSWLGFNRIFGFAANGLEWLGYEPRQATAWTRLSETFPGLGEEFMPTLNEGSFLLMPTSMPHAGMQENLSTLQQLDMRVQKIPEVDLVVGKMGRVESALDPAPISMYENIINYLPEYRSNEKGQKMRFATDSDGHYRLNPQGKSAAKKNSNSPEVIHKLDRQKQWIILKGDTLSMPEFRLLQNQGDYPKIEEMLISDSEGDYYRNWRPYIQSPDDIWSEIAAASELPGVTAAPKLQPIETRLVMLQTGMRAPMGIKVSGPDLKTIEQFGFKLEEILKEVPSVKKSAVYAERVVGKPYLEIDIDRLAIARYGLSIEQVQKSLEGAIGGVPLTHTVEGRERYPIRVRYPRELRDEPDEIEKILITNNQGTQVPLGQLAHIRFKRGPQVIKSEETFLTSYVLFDKEAGFAPITVVEDAQNAIDDAVSSGKLTVPKGVNYRFAGDYENQQRAEKRLSIVVPVVLILIFLILYFQFRSVATTLMVFSGIALAFAGGFIMLWLYGQDWFLNLNTFDIEFRDLFQVKTINLSVAVWVGFIALFGIATDDGVLMATYLDQRFAKGPENNKSGIRKAVIEAAQRRVRPALMTTATTLIALIPILTSTGKGANIMVPMAIPAVGGMSIALITIFLVPVLYAFWQERSFNKNKERE